MVVCDEEDDNDGEEVREDKDGLGAEPGGTDRHNVMGVRHYRNQLGRPWSTQPSWGYTLELTYLEDCP